MANAAITEAQTAARPGFGAAFASGVRSRAWGLGSIIGGLLLWELVSRFIVGSKLFLAAPSQVVLALIDLAGSGELEKHIYVSGVEFLLGYTVACVLGVL